MFAMTAPSTVMTIEAFEAECLDIFDRMDAGEDIRLIITRNGVPIARVIPAPSADRVHSYPSSHRDDGSPI